MHILYDVLCNNPLQCVWRVINHDMSNNITINTEIMKNDTKVDGLAVRFDLAELAHIANTKGLAGANDKLDAFVNRYTADLKKKIAESLKK